MFSHIFAENKPTKTEAGVCSECSSETLHRDNGAQAAARLQPLRQFISATLTTEFSAEADIIVQNFKRSGFVCDDKNSDRADRAIECKGQTSAYPKTVHVYIPRKLKNEKQIKKANYFFHGFRNGQTFQKNKDNLNGVGDFAAMLEKSKAEDSILIVPESDGQCDDYKKIISNTKIFLDLQAEIEKKSGAKFSETTLSGHSGAYLTLDALLKNPEIGHKVKSIAMFDSIYDSQNSLPNTRAWLASSQENKMKISYVVGQRESTRIQTEKFLFLTKNLKNQIAIQILNGNVQGAHMSAMQNGGFSDFLK